MLSPAPAVPARSSSPSPGSSPSPTGALLLPLRRPSPSLPRLASKQKPPSKRSCLLGGFFVCKLPPRPTPPLRLGEGSPPASPPELLFKVKAKNFPSKESSLPSARRGAFVRREIPFLSNEKVSPSEGKVFPFRRAKNFLPQENLFPCGRKNIFLRKEIYFCAHENKFPHMRKYFFVYTEINFLICGNLTPCKPAGNAGSEKGKFDGRKGDFPWVKRGWFSWLRRRLTGAVREGGRRREVGWGANKKVGSRGRRAPCPTANSFRCA